MRRCQEIGRIGAVNAREREGASIEVSVTIGMWGFVGSYPRPPSIFLPRRRRASRKYRENLGPDDMGRVDPCGGGGSR